MNTKQPASAPIYTEYDSFAWFYNEYWGAEFSRSALTVYRILLFPQLAHDARVLDLCCGTGQLAAELCERGYQVTGLDGSAAMLRFARANAPQAEFVQADARDFTFAQPFAAVISAFDSLNHVMRLGELQQVFENVYHALAADGLFLFDLNMEHEREQLEQTLEMIEDDHVCVARANYDIATKCKRYDVTMFRLDEARRWQRSDVTLLQRYYTETEIKAALAAAGFRQVMTYDAHLEFGMTLSDGRMFYLARKS